MKLAISGTEKSEIIIHDDVLSMRDEWLEIAVLAKNFRNLNVEWKENNKRKVKKPI